MWEQYKHLFSQSNLNNSHSSLSWFSLERQKYPQKKLSEDKLKFLSFSKFSSLFFLTCPAEPRRTMLQRQSSVWSEKQWKFNQGAGKRQTWTGFFWANCPVWYSPDRQNFSPPLHSLGPGKQLIYWISVSSDMMSIVGQARSEIFLWVDNIHYSWS